MYKWVAGLSLMIAVWGVACGSLGREPVGEQVHTSEMSGSVTGSQVIAPTEIYCGEATQVTLTLDAETGIAGNPLDIMLVLDRSGSMAGIPLSDLKIAANQFVNLIDETTDGVLDGQIGNGSRVGVVSFAGDASLDQGLTDSATDVKIAINALSAFGSTDHEAAFALTEDTFVAQSPSNDKVVVMMTDGQTTAGGDPDDDAASLRNIAEIFLIGINAANTNDLNEWATDPDADHVFTAPDSSDLEEIFEAIGAAITVPAATNVTVVIMVSDHFNVSNATANKGVENTVGNTITWTIDELGTETVMLTYTATHDPTQPGGVETLHVVTYSDDEDNQVAFGDATVLVRGCAATLELEPEMDTNTVGDDHTVTATVLDDFGDPVSGITVDFMVTGEPSLIDDEPSNPAPAAGSGVTDALGQATFTYTNNQASPDTIIATVSLQTNVSVVLEDTANKTWEPISAVIDIKPGSDPNSYGADSRGNIPVALLGSDVFDVTLVDDVTVRFGDGPDAMGDAAIAHGSGHFEHVNGDGEMDKVYHFPFPDTNLDPGDTEGCLSGEMDELDFLGCDSVNIVPGS